jgi:hypothetical protein
LAGSESTNGKPVDNDAAWVAERQWLIDFMRRGSPLTSEAERPRVRRVLDRWQAEVRDSIERFAVHEAGHVVVAHALGWIVESVEPDLPDGSGGGAMTYQRQLERDAWGLFVEQATVAVAGHVAEEIEFGLALPFEVMELRDRAWEEHGVGDDQLSALVEHAETQARTILTACWVAVERLAQAQIARGRVEGVALAEILTAREYY